MFWTTSLRPGHRPPHVTTAAVTCIPSLATLSRIVNTLALGCSIMKRLQNMMPPPPPPPESMHPYTMGPLLLTNRSQEGPHRTFRSLVMSSKWCTCPCERHILGLLCLSSEDVLAWGACGKGVGDGDNMPV
jgi:hypothetical protein